MASSGGRLDGRVALVTGVSRRRGIGASVARRLGDLGAAVVATGWRAHDAEMPWGEDPADVEPVPGLDVGRHDLEDPAVPAALVDEVVAAHGRLDVVVAVHAHSSSGGLLDVTADELDRCWAANVRSVVLLAQRWARVRPPGEPLGKLLWFTSGQHLGPMSGELAYAISKGALHQLTRSLADALTDHGIVANCVNPGPVDTGWADDEVHEIVRRRFPDGRWGTPDDVANLVAFLVADEGSWIRGQVIDSEGGFRR